MTRMQAKRAFVYFSILLTMAIFNMPCEFHHKHSYTQLVLNWTYYIQSDMV